MAAIRHGGRQRGTAPPAPFRAPRQRPAAAAATAPGARRNRHHGCDGWQSIGQPQLEVLAVASQQHRQPSLGIGQTTLDSRRLGLRVNEKTSRLVETVKVGQAAARVALRLRPQKSTS